MKPTCRIRSIGLPVGAVLILLLGFGGLTGCGEEAPTAATENLLVPAHAGPNTPITVNNVQSAVLQAVGAFSGSIPTIAHVASGKQAAAKPAGAQSIAIPELVINGERSGLLRISNAQLSLGISNTQTLMADLVFDDFSTDGMLYIGGPVRFELKFSLVPDLGAAPSTEDLSDLFENLRVGITGQIGLSGTYSGVLALDVYVVLSDLGITDLTGEISLDGHTVELSGI